MDFKHFKKVYNESMSIEKAIGLGILAIIVLVILQLLGVIHLQ
jgi:hypothetical protein